MWAMCGVKRLVYSWFLKSERVKSDEVLRAGAQAGNRECCVEPNYAWTTGDLRNAFSDQGASDPACWREAFPLVINLLGTCRRQKKAWTFPSHDIIPLKGFSEPSNHAS